MDPVLFQIVLGVAGFLAAGAITMAFKQQAATTSAFAAFREHVAENYVPKSDYRADMTEIKGDLKEILRELSNKEDRR